MKIKKPILTDILYLLIPFLYIESVFHFNAFGFFDIYTIIRIILFNTLVSIIIVFIFSKISFKYRKWIYFSIVLLMAIYGFVELEFKNFLDNYYSLSAVSDGAGRIKEYVIYFIMDAKPQFYLTFIAPIIMLVINIRIIDHSTLGSNTFLNTVNLIFVSLLITLTLDVSLGLGKYLFSLRDTYKNFNNTELLLNKIGLNHFLYRDITALFIESENEIIIKENPEPTNPIPTNVSEPVFIVDDERWINDSINETNEKIKNIDNYLIARKQTSDNDMTGIFKDYNLIYILVESFDYMAIDEKLTPTLYMMMNNSLFFDNHYTPKFSCTTGESEFIAMTSLVPFNDVCTPNYVTNNAYPQALSNLFKNAGYHTTSFHNWYDQYYDRRNEHKSWGIDKYYDVYDLGISFIHGWQSDETLIEKASEYFMNEEPFFSLIISSSMHWPYDSNSNLGDKYLNIINEVHPDYPIEIKRYLSKSMEFDKAMEKLIELLKEKDVYENTVITLFSDHHPFKLSISSIQEHSLLRDRYSEHGEDLTPFIIYNPTIKPHVYSNIMSTFDQTPTLANLFGLNYDSRLYIGTDIFSNEATVIFPNSDWINEEGIFISSKNQFTGNMEDDYISSISLDVQNDFNVSYLIMNNDYFKNRMYLADPIYKEYAGE